MDIRPFEFIPQDELVFKRADGSSVTVPEAVCVIADMIAGQPDRKYDLTVGTDSQNFDSTKMVEVIAVHRVGSGGIFFYRVDFVRRIRNLRQKIQEETTRSLHVADGLVSQLDKALADRGLDINALDIHTAIHCDIGRAGSTKDLIREIVGWVQAMGYECRIKPESYAASGVANKYSK